MKNKELWDSFVENNTDPYGSACIKVEQIIDETLSQVIPTEEEI